MSTNLDIYPTLLDLLDIDIPSDRTIDGNSILPLITENKDSPHEFVFYNASGSGDVVGVRDSIYKYHEGANGNHLNLMGNWGPAFSLGKQLTNLNLDNEAHNLIRKYPERADQLKLIMDNKQKEFEENRRGWL